MALRVLERHSLSLQADEQRTLEEIELAKQRLPREALSGHANAASACSDWPASEGSSSAWSGSAGRE